jgi:hypothetical protein
MDILRGAEPNTRDFSQKFELYSSSISHNNRLEVEQADSRAETLMIRNHFATTSGGQVVKITEIHLEDRIIKIIDTFTSVPRH